MTDNGETKFKFIKNQLIFHKEIWYSTKESVTIGISEKQELFEITEFGINSICDLSSKPDKESQEAFAEVINNCQNINIDTFHSYKNDELQIHILVTIGSTLYVVKKSRNGLILHSAYKNVGKFEIIDDDNLGDCSVKITFNNERVPIETKFLRSNESGSNAKELENCDFSKVSNVLNDLKEKSFKTESKLRQLEIDTRKYFTNVEEKLKFIPASMRTDIIDEKTPLIRYGDIWTRVFNDKLVVGIPLLNCSFKRRFVLENLDLIIDCPKIDELEYSFNLYKLMTDSYTFEQFETLFLSEDEETIPKEPQFSVEWNHCEKRFLHAEQSAVFVAVLDMNCFREIIEYDFKVFITYEINSGEKKIPLQLFAGELNLTTDIFENGNCDITKDQKYIYKNLLAITATSKQLKIILVFKSEPSNSFYSFLVKTLKFEEITEKRIEEESRTHPTFQDSQMMGLDFDETEKLQSKPKRSHIYVGKGNYFNGFIVRADELENLKLNVKLYARNNHQVLTFVKSIYADYSENCDVFSLNKYNADESTEQILKSSINDKIKLLLDELDENSGNEFNFIVTTNNSKEN